jgi:hypothetical protein
MPTAQPAQRSGQGGVVQDGTAAEPGGPSIGDKMKDAFGGLFGGTGVTRRKDTMVEAMVKSTARSIGSQVGREIIRGVLGSILKK